MILSHYNEELHLETVYNDGFKDGFEDGNKSGEDRVSNLIQQLVQAERIDDIKKATSDPDFRRQLLEEFNL